VQAQPCLSWRALFAAPRVLGYSRFGGARSRWQKLADDFQPPVSGSGPVTLNPLATSTEDPPQQRNAAVMTVDQRLTKDISFFGEGFYSNRRVEAISPCDQTPTNTDCISGVGVPTWNPYYPTNAPSNLRVSYNLAIEDPAIANASELAERYAGGLNIELPAEWHGQVYMSKSFDQNNLFATSANKAGVSAALGWTIQPVAATGTGPSFGTWTKPSSVPYLNLFCDPFAFKCNSPTTINYLTGSRTFNESMTDTEHGLKFDGPLFDLPGGPVKAAIGGMARPGLHVQEF
jgi:iron complex outermembrane receptor protein